MRVMVLGKANEGGDKSAPPTAEAFAAMDRFTDELAKAGVATMATEAMMESTAPEMVTSRAMPRTFQKGRDSLTS